MTPRWLLPALAGLALMLTTALAAGPDASGTTSARPAGDGGFAATKESYVTRAQTTLESWKRKLGAAAEQTGAQARAAGSSADAELHSAWRRTEVEAKRLEAASADGWDRAKSAFEKASDDLRETWNRMHPDDKR